MQQLVRRARCVRGSRILEILQRYDARSLADPFMGLPTHLNYLKRHGIAVHGGDLLSWPVCVGKGLIANDLTLLRDDETAAIVEAHPGRIYSGERFMSWEGASLSEEHCTYLGVWRENVRELRSEAQTGLAVLGLWRVFCYWLQKAEEPDAMEDIAPAELAWHYVRQASQWVATNGRRNTVRCADAAATIEACNADALLLAPPARGGHRSIDPRIWMWEAWWRGNPAFTLEQLYAESTFGSHPSETEYEAALKRLIEKAVKYPLILLLTTSSHAPEAESLLRNSGRTVEALRFSEEEVYLVAKV